MNHSFGNTHQFARLFLTGLFLAIFFITSTGQNVNYTLHSDSKVSVTGGSTLHDWEAKVGTFEGAVILMPALLKSKIKAVPAVASVDFSFQAESLDGGRGPVMNKKIKTALKSTTHPAITFISNKEAVVKEASTEGAFTLSVSGTLTIAGVNQELTLELAGQRLEEDDFSFKGSIPLTLSQFNISPPSAMFGQIVVKEEIAVQLDLRITRS